MSDRPIRPVARIRSLRPIGEVDMPRRPARIGVVRKVMKLIRQHAADRKRKLPEGEV